MDPKARTLEIHGLESARRVVLAAIAGQEILRAEPFAEVELELGRLWP